MELIGFAEVDNFRKEGRVVEEKTEGERKRQETATERQKCIKRRPAKS